jgi:glucose/arabinose dehydrogenase
VVAKLRKLALLLAALVLIVATQSCGGGTDDPVNPPPPPPGPITATLNAIATGFVNPLGIVQPNDGSGRFFVLEQRGMIRIIQNGAVVGTPFLDIQSIVEDGGELGLLGLAFHPQFAQNRRFYLNYTTTRLTGGLQTVIAEYLASQTNPNQADTAERILLQINQPFDNHNGGQLAFGSDGFLYIALGDGGGGGDPANNGQRLDTLLGKILRIDVNGNNSSNGQYGVPANNPFVSGGGQPEIWAFGLRNPWRFSFDTVSGRLFCGDVGQNEFEEIDIIVRGGNYGWRVMEGAHCFSPSSGCNQSGLILPIAEYSHSEGEAVIGGFVYRGTAIPSLQGLYVFGDLSSGNIWTLRETSSGTWTRTLLLTTTRTISSFGQDQAGEIYVLDYVNGIVLRLSP